MLQDQLDVHYTQMIQVKNHNSLRIIPHRHATATTNSTCLTSSQLAIMAPRQFLARDSEAHFFFKYVRKANILRIFISRHEIKQRRLLINK
jgi:hypothetical protein